MDDDTERERWRRTFVARSDAVDRSRRRAGVRHVPLRPDTNIRRMSSPKRDLGRLTLEEEARLDSLHPTPEDVPGCLDLFDTFMQCYGPSIRPARTPLAFF